MFIFYAREWLIKFGIIRVKDQQLRDDSILERDPCSN